MDNQMIAANGLEYVMNTYGRFPMALVKGEGAKVWDADGVEYIDLVAGIAVNNVGHCHPEVVEAIREQAGRLLHCSNLYWIENQINLAKSIVDNSCAEKVFFCNSGAEANEGALKLARRWASRQGHTDKVEVISALNSFHGRTMGALSATGQTVYQAGFGPLVPHLLHVQYNDLDSLKEAVSEKTCAVLLETVQGEGGIIPLDPAYLAGLMELKEQYGFLLMIDEVQTGMGRTGKLFGHQRYGFDPDVFTLAKALGGGLPIGALCARGDAALALQPGEHASTFGGGPLVTAAAQASFDVITKGNLPEAAEEKGQYIKAQVASWPGMEGVIKDVRGQGLMIGIELIPEGIGVKIVEACRLKGVLINCIHGMVLRMVPPLVITKEEIDKALGVLQDVIKAIA
ncbi:MAG: aspartate aminotransferase family protein [Clostridiales bacterium]|nr:aspartate aminotransferase family protein [Clostridiales bacterium]